MIVGSAKALSQRPMQCIELANQQFVLIFYEKEFYLLDNLCPHKAAALCDGDLKGSTISCPWHKALFDIKTNRGLSPLAGKGVRSWPLHIENDQLMANLEL